MKFAIALLLGSVEASFMDSLFHKHHKIGDRVHKCPSQWGRVEMFDNNGEYQEVPYTKEDYVEMESFKKDFVLNGQSKSVLKDVLSSFGYVNSIV